MGRAPNNPHRILITCNEDGDDVVLRFTDKLGAQHRLPIEINEARIVASLINEAILRVVLSANDPDEAKTLSEYGLEPEVGKDTTAVS